MRTISLLLAVAMWAAPLAAADFFPLEEVHPGLQGVGRTVFAGDRVEEFQVEILGVLENIAPRQSLILARLSGGPLAETGVMAGMSGSPIYLEGRLAGAIAYSFPFSTEPIAGIRPIHEMIENSGERAEGPRPAARAVLAAFPLADGSASERLVLDRNLDLLPPGAEPLGEQPRMVPVATTVALAGFTERSFELFAPTLRQLGLRPMQGVGGRSGTAPGKSAAPVEPGSMISVALIRGDMDVTASGTVTHVDGDRIYAFGHRFLSSGPTEMPLMRSSVVALVPNLANSFKIAATGPLMGAITDDRTTGITGRVGEAPKMLPLELHLHSSREREHSYRLDLVNDRFLTPFLVQMAVFSAADATERQLGASSYRVRGTVEFEGAAPALRLDNMFAGASNLPMAVATATAIPLAYLMQSGLQNLAVRRIDLEIESIDEERQLQINRIWASRNKVRPGEWVELAAALRSPDGEEIVKKTTYRIPTGMAPGALHVSVSDGMSLNYEEWQSFANPRQARDLEQLVRAMNRLRRNDRLYVRVWRPTRGFRLQTERLPSPPSSVAAVLSGPVATGEGVTREWHSTLAEVELDGFDSVVKGNLTMKISVRE